MSESFPAGSVSEKRVGWAELFFDLVFVVAVTRVSGLLGRDHSVGGLVRGLLVFVPIYWLWVGAAIQTNLLDVGRPGPRLRLFAVALAGIYLAIALDDAYGGLGLLFALAYWAGRIVLGGSLLVQGSYRTLANPYIVSIVVTGPLLVVGALLEGNARVAVWAVAALVDLSAPTLLKRRLAGMHFDPGHLAERFGLFVLIALGESVVAFGSVDTDHLTVGEGVAVAAAFALTVGLWWVYFHFAAADAVRHALATAVVQLDITRRVLSYGHLAFIASIIVVSVGLQETVTQPGEQLSGSVVALLYGGTATYLATFGFTRWAMFRLVSWTRLGAAVVVLVAAPLAPMVPALAALVVLATIVAALNAVELARNDRIGWRARLSRRGSVPGAAGPAPADGAP